MKTETASILDLQATRADLLESIVEIEAQVSRIFKWQWGSLMFFAVVRNELQTVELAGGWLVLSGLGLVLLILGNFLWTGVNTTVPLLVYRARVDITEIQIRTELLEHIQKLEAWIVKAQQRQKYVGVIGWVGVGLMILSLIGL